MDQVEKLDKVVLETENRDLKAALHATQSVDEAEIRRLWCLVEELEVKLASAQMSKAEADETTQKNVSALAKKLEFALKETEKSQIKAKESDQKAKYAQAALDSMTKELEELKDLSRAYVEKSEVKETAQLKKIQDLQLEVATLRARGAASQITIKRLQEQLQISSVQLAQHATTVGSSGQPQAMPGLQKMLDDMRQEIKSSIRDELRQSVASQFLPEKPQATRAQPMVPLVQYAPPHPRPMTSAAHIAPPQAMPSWQQTHPLAPTLPPPPWLAGRAEHLGKAAQDERGEERMVPAERSEGGGRTRPSEKEHDDRGRKRARQRA